MNECDMADNVVASRREARRRRILENSTGRLQKITGRADSGLSVTENGCLSAESILTFSENTNGNVCSLPTTQNHVETDGCGSEPSSEETSHLGSFLNQIGLSDEGSVYFQQEEEPQSRILQIIFSSRLHLVCLAAIVKLLFAFNYGYLFGESIFVPLILLELVYVLSSIDKKQQSSGILGAALLLSGIKPQTVTVISNILQAVQKIINDFTIFFFCFITLHSILETPG